MPRPSNDEKHKHTNHAGRASTGRYLEEFEVALYRHWPVKSTKSRGPLLLLGDEHPLHINNIYAARSGPSSPVPTSTGLIFG